MNRPQATAGAAAKDYFVREHGAEYAGKHLLIDIWGGRRLDDAEHLRAVLTRAVASAGATLLHLHVHQFSPAGGLSATAVLAESHLNVHTWPERGYAAFDVFMCGSAQPERAVDIIRASFRPETLTVETKRRGLLPNPPPEEDTTSC